MPKITLLQVLGFTILHLIVTSIALLFAIEGLPGMEDPNWSPSLVGRIADVLFQILSAPMVIVWITLGLGAKMPDALEWTLYFLNSVIWGVGLSYLRAWRLRKARA